MNREYVTEGVAEFVLGFFPEGFRGVAVDVGAFDPMWLSNSWILERSGWDVFCIEPNPSCIPRLQEAREHVIECACGEANADDVNLFVFRLAEKEGEAAGTGLIDHRLDPISGQHHEAIYQRSVPVRVRTLDWLMEHEIRHERIDFLSIDVEHNEMAVLAGTDLARWRPAIISIENCTADSVLRASLVAAGYRLRDRFFVNDVFVQTKRPEETTMRIGDQGADRLP